MKKIFIIAAFALTLLFTGCNKSGKPQASYTKGIELIGETGSGNFKTSELYTFQKEAISKLQGKYNFAGLLEDDDAKALEDFDAAVLELGEVLAKFQEKVMSGADFGSDKFTVSYKYSVAKENKILKESESVIFTYDPTSIEWQGVIYKAMTFANGQTWMLENLRYVPNGATIQTPDAPSNNGIFYPGVWDGTAVNPVKTDEKIKELGLLYTAKAAFGVSDNFTKENCKSFEGCQGICPNGWHIPTFNECLDLVGCSSKISNASVGGYEKGSTPLKKDALFYNEAYNGGKISEMNKNKFGFVYSPALNGTSYMKPTVKDGVTYGAMTYIAGSTVYNPDAATIQFMTLMSTNNATYPDGRLTVAFANNTMATSVRCVKNQSKK